MIGRDVSISVDGTQMAGYVARPEEDSGSHPAVIVLQEVFGLTPEVRRVTDLLASIGYVGLAIDYYHRTNPSLSESYTEEGSARAFAAAANVTGANMSADVRAAIDWLSQQPFVRPGKYATWGFGFGATGAFVAGDVTELSGAICFYPGNVMAPLPAGGEAPIERAADLKIPLLLVFGEQDYYVSRFDMGRMETALQNAGAEFRMQIYPQVGHSFFRHGRPEAVVEHHRYSDEAIAHAVADSWDLVRMFLKDIFSRQPVRADVTGDIRTPRTQSLR